MPNSKRIANSDVTKTKYDADGNIKKTVEKTQTTDTDADGNVLSTNKTKTVTKFKKGHRSADADAANQADAANNASSTDGASNDANITADGAAAGGASDPNPEGNPDLPPDIKGNHQPDPSNAPAQDIKTPTADDTPKAETPSADAGASVDAPAPDAPSGGGIGLPWFNQHWQTIAIVAGGAALLFALAKLVKKMNQSIKIRFQKCANTLQRMQKDFTLKESGLDMKAVLPGVGSRLMDVFARVWTGMFKRNKANTGAIGLHPFCQGYKDEIANDFKSAQEAYSKIKAAADGAANAPKTESYGTTYNSFREAFMASGVLNENKSSINESALAIGTVLSLGALAVRGGMFILSKIKNGKVEKDSGQAVQVTKESTREICYAIMYNFMSKYINMDAVMEKIGVNSKDLADLDKSSVEKLKGVLKKYEGAAGETVTKQYARIKAMYDNMLSHYYKIGDGLISNFYTYTKAPDEKHKNLLVASREKLQAMWDKQKDIYNNNFSHVILEIVKSKEYISYLNFIIEKVIPVFASGLAGDADYVLDVMPKEGEHYIIRQTNEQSQVKPGDTAQGNIALAQVLGFNQNTKEIKFKLLGLIKSSITYNDDNTVTIAKPVDMDSSAYVGKDEQTLDYGKWLSLDPHLTEYDGTEQGEETTEQDASVNEPSGPSYTAIYYRQISEADTQTNEPAIADYIVGVSTVDVESGRTITPTVNNTLNEIGETDERTDASVAQDGSVNADKFNTVLYVQASGDPTQSMSIKGAIRFVLSNTSFNSEEFKKFATFKEEKNPASMGFTVVTAEMSETLLEQFGKLSNVAAKQIGKLADIPPLINKNATKSADKLFANIDKITTDVYNAWKGANISMQSFEPVNNQFYAFKTASPVNLAGVEHSIPVDTQCVNSANDKIMVYVVPKMYYNGKTVAPNMAQNGKLPDDVSTNIKFAAELCLGTDKSFVRGNNQNVMICPDMTNIQAIKGILQRIFTHYKNYKDKNGKELIADSVNTEYSVAVSESKNASVIVKRKISFNNTGYTHIITEHAWSDGTILDPVAYLKKRAVGLTNMRTFDALCKYAKVNENVRIDRYSNESEYCVKFPANHSALLTDGNGLFESMVLVAVDNNSKISAMRVLKIKKVS